MTKKQLLETLSQPGIPDDAVLLAFDPEEMKVMEVTGITYGINPQANKYEIEFFTDES